MEKRIRQIVPVLLAVILTISGVCGCARASSQEKTSIRIGVSLYKGDDTFINNIRMEMEEKAKAYEQKHGIKVTLDIQDAKGNQNTQNTQVERFISLGCDVLCVNPVDRMASSSIIDKAMTAQIPVVFFNRQPVEEDMDLWDQLYYVGVDAKETAVLQGNIVASLYKNDPSALDFNGDGVISYVLLEGENSHQDSLIRTEWSIQTLKDAEVPIEKLTGAIANWERSQASAIMEQWLKEYGNEIELVISNNDDMALGAIDAIERDGIHKINLVGIDATVPGIEAVENGKMLGTVSCDKETYAEVIVELAASKALGSDMPEWISLKDGKYYWCAQEILLKNEK